MKRSKFLFFTMATALIVILISAIIFSNYHSRSIRSSQLITNIDTASVLFRYDSLAKALDESKHSGKLVFLFLGQKNQYETILTEHLLDSNVQIQQHLNAKFICAKSIIGTINDSSNSHEQFRQRFGLNQLPACLLLDSLGTVLDCLTGLPQISEMLKFGEMGFVKSDFSASIALYGPDSIVSREQLIAFLENAPPITEYSQLGYRCPQQYVLTRYFSTLTTEEYTTPENWEIIERFVVDPESHIFQYLHHNPDAFYAKLDPEVVDKKILDVLNLWYQSKDSKSAATKYIDHTIRRMNTDYSKAIVWYSAKERINFTSINAYVNRYDSIFSRFYFAYKDAIYKTAWQTYNYGAPEETDVTHETVENVTRWVRAVLEYTHETKYHLLYAKLLFLQGNKSASQIEIKKAIDAARISGESENVLNELELTASQIESGELLQYYEKL